MENKMSETKVTEEEIESHRDVEQKQQPIQRQSGALSMQKLDHETQAEALWDREDTLIGELEGL